MNICQMYIQTHVQLEALTFAYMFTLKFDTSESNRGEKVKLNASSVLYVCRDTHIK